jgi:hypothetical protein
MKTKLSCALGLALLAASFTFGGAVACPGATETISSALQTLAPDSEANVTVMPSYGSGVQTGVAEAQPAEVDQPSSVVSEIEPSSIDAPTTGDAILVEITLTVTIVVPGQIVEDNEEPTHTGSIILEPSVILNDAQKTALDDVN